MEAMKAMASSGFQEMRRRESSGDDRVAVLDAQRLQCIRRSSCRVSFSMLFLLLALLLCRRNYWC
ncbi:uncharacterized protein G2W53_021672 [Senna tora]|uniref:Uncharacterized protein n=1 Tax=Senna tora TaxID=362788 RepID=A0A834TJX7_9FABA|nr:uncharacterized protein G2W53_021672 [Senna tora]